MLVTSKSIFLLLEFSKGEQQDLTLDLLGKRGGGCPEFLKLEVH